MQLIMWDPDFMGELDRSAGTKWASVAVLAHEIAHHANNDTGQGRLPAHKRREQELYADRWAGQRLRSFGARRNEAVAVFAQMGEGGETHPPSRQRVAAAGEGWDRAEEGGLGTGRSTGPSTRSPPPQPRLAQFCLDGFGNPVCPTRPRSARGFVHVSGYRSRHHLLPLPGAVTPGTWGMSEHSGETDHRSDRSETGLDRESG